jgi:hypothetical protein
MLNNLSLSARGKDKPCSGKTFSLRVVLSCTTGRVLTGKCQDDLYELFQYTIKAGVNSCSRAILSPLILKIYPELQEADDALPMLDDLLLEYDYDPSFAVDCWIEYLKLGGLEDEYIIPTFQKIQLNPSP